MNNKINTRYFSGAQASIHIGDIWVDDVVGGSYSVTNSKKPIWGYGSTYFDAVAGGQEIVQGTLEINFREPNYLWMILEIKDIAARALPSFNAPQKDGKDVSTKDTIAMTGRQDLYSGNNPVIRSNDTRMNFEALMSVSDPEVAKQILRGKYDRSIQSIKKANNNVSDYKKPFFDIVIAYGEQGRIAEKIKNCTILGKAKQIEASGQPIREAYSFIGQKNI